MTPNASGGAQAVGFRASRGSTRVAGIGAAQANNLYCIFLVYTPEL